MKKLLFISAAFIAVVSISSCGSTWTVSGNSVNIEVAKTDTVVKKGTLILTPDTPVNVKRFNP